MIRKFLMAGLLALGVASAAHAATRSPGSPAPSHATPVAVTSIGPRLGFSVDPDQFVVGGHMNVAFAPDWTFNPSIELGFGDHQQVTALNFDGEYHFRLQGSAWAPYVGAGLSVDFVSFDNSPFPDTNDTVTGLNVIIGTSVPTASGNHLFGEFRLGAGDTSVPELKGIVGWNFRL